MAVYWLFYSQLHTRSESYETFDQIRQTDKDVPVIAFTGYAFPHDRDKIIGRGFAAHIPKPILDLDEFVNEISRHIQKPRRGLKAS